MKKILPRIAALACASLLLVGCATDIMDETHDWPVDKIYAEAKSAQDSAAFERSIKLFERLQARYPYNRFAQMADLDIAYNQLKLQEPLLAIAAVERFMKSNPLHPHMDYAYYLLGLANYNDAQGFLSAIAPQDMAERDPKSSRAAFDAFQTLVRRYPDSAYVIDATKRLNYLIGSLAMHEVHVARYYYKRNAYLAAANRAKLLLQTYPQTVQVEQALALLVMSYDKLGEKTLRDDARRILDKNYPGSKALNDDFINDRYWWAPG